MTEVDEMVVKPAVKQLINIFNEMADILHIAEAGTGTYDVSVEVNRTANIDPGERYSQATELYHKSINGVPIIPAVSNRMMTSYLFHDRTTELGFEVATGAKQINWIITPRNLPIAISKLVTLNVYAPGSESKSDDWVNTYRRFHNLWIMVSQINQIIVSVSV